MSLALPQSSAASAEEGKKIMRFKDWGRWEYKSSGYDRTTLFINSQHLCLPAQDQDSQYTGVEWGEIHDTHHYLRIYGQLMASGKREPVFFKGVAPSG